MNGHILGANPCLSIQHRMKSLNGPDLRDQALLDSEIAFSKHYP